MAFPAPWMARLRVMRRRVAFLEALVDRLPVMVFAKDPGRDHRYILWNRRTEDALGIPREEVLGRRDLDIFPQEQAEFFRAIDQKVLTSGAALEVEDERVLGRKGLRRVHILKATLRGPSGSPCLVGIAVDVAERAAIREDLARSRASLAEAQRLAHLGSWEWDLPEERGYWSEELYRLLGFEPGTPPPGLAGLLERCHPADRPALEEALKGLAEDGSPRSLEHRALTPEGRLRHLFSRMEARKDQAGHVIRLLGTTQDLTERKTAEQALEQAQKRESLGTLAGGIAHDYNNLLMAMQGHLALLQARLPKDNGVKDHIAALERAISKAAALSGQMLAYSGRGVFVVEPMDLNAAVRRSEALLASSVSKKVDLRFDLEPQLPPVEADETQVQQALVNLMTNAAEALEGREGRISVRTSFRVLRSEDLEASFLGQRVEAGPHVVLSVEDTGCGMLPEAMARLFDPFYTTKARGWGLGLCVLQGILRAHHAGIQVQSRPGEGSAFHLLFPAARPALPAPPAPALPAEGKVRILLVEDEEDIRSATAELLDLLGYEVLQAEDGVEAMAHMESGTPVHLVLLDLSMPRMDGHETLAALHAAHPATPVILCSGYSEQEALKGTERRRIAGFLQKPYRFKDLEGLLQEVLA